MYIRIVFPVGKRMDMCLQRWAVNIRSVSEEHVVWSGGCSYHYLTHAPLL